MAEAVISLVIERIGDLLIQKCAFLKDVRRQLERLRDDLVWMRCFLKDADQRQDEDERIRNWVSEIRHAAYDAEDVIEIFASKIELIKDEGFINKLVYYPSKTMNLYKIGKEIESLQMRLNNTADNCKKYGIRNLGEGMSTQREELRKVRQSSPKVEDKDIVGFEEITKSLVAELLKEDGNRVVSIVGMGGAGKTTLAKKVYNHADVRAKFNCRAWVCVSSIYNHKETLRTIIKQLNLITNELLDMLEKMQEQDLEGRLYNDLQHKCYLVVLDDVWKEAAWDCLARAFPDVGTSSRLLLTSRNRDVAERALSIPHELKTLGEEDSWQLFLRKALGHEADVGCPPDLEEVGREIARRCAGLPLAITVIGGLLWAKKKLKSEWEKLLNNFSRCLSRSESRVSAILELSYAELPPNLKFCFLYLGLFPEDSVIPKRKLIHMWVAEGIIQQRGGKELEETAEYYLDQLLSRNMVQVGKTTIDQRIKSCRVHDLLRDLAIRKAEDENFFQITDIRDDEISARSRYLAVHPLPQYKEYFGVSTPHLRSLIFVNFLTQRGEVSLSFKSFKKLRVLDLENVKINSLPKEIGGVRLLRYLCLRRTGIKELPHSLGCLRNLQALDIFNRYQEVQVSDFVSKLESLRHLYARRITCNVPLKIEGLRNLETLLGVHYDDIMHNKMVTLTSLRKLGIVVDYTSAIDELCVHLSEVGSLKTLCLCASLGDSLPPLAGLSRLHHVTELKLSGELRMLPPDFPPLLSRLSLTSTDLEEDPMPVLEKLGQLSVLEMKHAYGGPQLIISSHGFPQLKFLELTLVPFLEEIKVEEAALPQLQCLRIGYCDSLRTLPEELKHISTLDRLELVNMPEDFVSRLDSEMTSTVPNLRIFNS